MDIDLLPSPVRSRFRRISGIISIILALVWFAAIIIIEASPSVLHIIFCIWFILYGTFYFLDGLGINILKWFGRAYLRIDEECLNIKKSVFLKEWCLYWEEVRQVEYFLLRIEFTLKGGVVRKLDYGNLDFVHIQEIKKSVAVIAVSKGIEVINAPI